MSGDYSRHTFDPKKHFSGVLMQQGRVQLDADWNELIEILDRRWRAETTDIIGRCTVPKETPNGFKIVIAAGPTLNILPGRIYVHGLLAENHGKPPLEFDHILAEQRGTLPVPYNEQPYLPNATPIRGGGGPHLVYLDVWQREVTFLQEPELIEKAVGVDTTTRLQTVWQVKVLLDVGAAVTCATPDEGIPGWSDLIQPSAGRLTTAAVGVASEDDPCEIPPSGGYRGRENQLYRVEIHNGGAVGTATFKWSRDNATIATSVTAIPNLDALIVASVGRDSILRFNAEDWVEITDDWREFAGLPGEMRKIKTVDDARRTITLHTPLTAGLFPTNAQKQTDPARHTRIRRWDQKGAIPDANGGVIPVPATGTPIVLEHGVQITFDLDPIGGNFHAGDYWTFAARTADASVEVLDHAPPRGIHHHYCRLALVTFPDAVTDCRTLWPPEFGGEGCDCSVCVTAASHNEGTLTIQHAIDQVKDIGGTVCLGPGIYNLREPLQIIGAQSVRLKGQGWKTILTFSGQQSAVRIERSTNVTIEAISLFSADLEQSETGSAGIALQNSVEVIIQHCLFVRVGSGDRGTPAIGVSGALFNTFIRENIISARIGIGNIMEASPTAVRLLLQPAPLLTSGFYVQDNTLLCAQRGISLEGMTLHMDETRLAGNRIDQCSQGGIVALGLVMPGSGFDVQGNSIRAAGSGMIIGADGARICDNDIGALQEGQSGDGINLLTGLNRDGIDRCQVCGNQIMGVAGDGIAIHTRLRSAMIKQNIIDGVGGGGIVMHEDGSAETLSIENNQLLNIAPQANDRTQPVVGIRLFNTNHAEVTSNTIIGVGLAAQLNPSRAGIQILASTSVRIAGNEVVNIGPEGDFVKLSAGIECLGTFERVEVVNNVVRRSQSLRQADTMNWIALHIVGPSSKFSGLIGGFGFVAGADKFFGFFGNRVLALPRGRESVSVQGNLFDAYGLSPAISINITGPVIFTNNRCLLASRSPLVAEMAMGAIIANANYFEGVQVTRQPAVVLQIPKEGPFTVLGNIASGEIHINGAALPVPWAPLNVIAS